MGIWSDLAGSIRKALLMQHQLDLLDGQVREIARKLENHEGRLIRVETIIELARRRQLPGE